MKKNKYLSIFKEGVLTNNPTFVQLLGMCPTLAVTTSVINALGMGAAVIVVLMCSNLFISLVRKLVPSEVRIASYIVIISGFVTAVELLIKAFFPDIDAALGLFIPLIVVNCIILARAEAFASKNPPLPSVVDGLACGIGFTLALVCIAAVRELLGTGMLFAAGDGTGGIRIFGDWFTPITVFLLPSGAFLTLGFLIALVQKITATRLERQRVQALELDALDAGYHKTLMRDPETGRIIKKADILARGSALPGDPREKSRDEDPREDAPAVEENQTEGEDKA